MTKRPWMWVEACLSIFLSRASLACTNIKVLHAWVREPNPVAQVAAGYFTMKNKGGTQTSIERVERSCCASVAMHQTKVSGDRVRMSYMDKLVVPAHATTSFNSGGPHLMLIAPSLPLRHHEKVDIEFYCAQGNPWIVEFEVVTAC